MKNLELKGCGTALITPFRNGEVDWDCYSMLIERQAAAGVDFLVALATTSETPTLTAEEKIKLLQLTHEHFDGPVVVGCGSNSVAGTLANMKLLEPYGVDAWLVVVPFYNKPTQEGMYLYFKTIAESTDKPVVLYNVPGRTGANMLPQTTLRLAKDVENIIAVKEASGKLDQMCEILSQLPEGFSFLSGDDDMTFELMKKGAAGVVSVASNLAPAEVAAMAKAALEGRMDEAAELDARLQPLFKNCFVESSPVPVKAGMEQLGLASSEMRLPLTPASPETRKIMSETISGLWK